MEFIRLSCERRKQLLSKEKEAWFAGLSADLGYANPVSQSTKNKPLHTFLLRTLGVENSAFQLLVSER